MDNFLSAIVNKLNDALFETLGLLLPSLVLCIILTEPLLYTRVIFFKNNQLSTIIEQIGDINQFWIVLFIIAIFYVIGNVIKVISKLYYDLGKSIFDNTIFKIIGCMPIKWIRKKIKEKYPKVEFKNCPVFTIINEIYIWVKKTLSFATVNYGNKFEEIYVYLAKEKLKIFDDEKDKHKNWYLFYKEATTILNQYNINTLYYKHLSKYNSFRSLECVFFFGILYNICFYNKSINHLLYFIVLGVNIVCLVSFHEKFKRYWMMCGNEVIAGLDYFYKNKKGNKENEE